MGHGCPNAMFRLGAVRCLSRPGHTDNSRVISLVPWHLHFEPGKKKKNQDQIFTGSHYPNYIPAPEMTGHSSDPKTQFLLMTFIVLPGKALLCWLQPSPTRH